MSTSTTTAASPVGSNTRRFEYVGGTSAKFWEISTSGKVINVRFGRLGTSGQAHVTEFADEAATHDEAEKLVRQKLAKGYREVRSV